MRQGGRALIALLHRRPALPRRSPTTLHSAPRRAAVTQHSGKCGQTRGDTSKSSSTDAPGNGHQPGVYAACPPRAAGHCPLQLAAGPVVQSIRLGVGHTCSCPAVPNCLARRCEICPVCRLQHPPCTQVRSTAQQTFVLSPPPFPPTTFRPRLAPHHPLVLPLAQQPASPGPRRLAVEPNVVWQLGQLGPACSTGAAPWPSRPLSTAWTGAWGSAGARGRHQTRCGFGRQTPGARLPAARPGLPPRSMPPGVVCGHPGLTGAPDTAICCRHAIKTRSGRHLRTSPTSLAKPRPWER